MQICKIKFVSFFRCWVTLSHSSHMLVLYIPLTIMLLVRSFYAPECMHNNYSL